MNTDQFKVGEFTFTRDPDGEVLLDIGETGIAGDAKMMKVEEVMELAQFLAGGIDIYQMFLTEEIRKAHQAGGMNRFSLDEAQIINDYNIAVINACSRIELCEQCQAQVKVDVKRHARKVREMNKLLFEDIRETIANGQSAYSKIIESTQQILTAMQNVEHICKTCHARQHEAIKKEFFRIRQLSVYQSNKGGSNE